ncbi:MAG TPA: hypothetical protein VNQ53_03060, partial [Nocardioides sp.]|nr:hypothetical protein [Nocardioides sp.]
RLAAELMATAAAHRTESRSGAAHRRPDHPATDDAVWRKAIVLSHDPATGVDIDYLVERPAPEPASAGGDA